jgi:hypothetical protein
LDKKETAQKRGDFEGGIQVINSDQIIVQLSVYLSGGEYATTIQGLNGSFDLDYMREFLGDEPPSYSDVYKEIEKYYGKVDESFYSVYALVKWSEPETQYGTGYGDILTLSGYYYIGEVLELTKHEDTDNASMITWCEHGKMLVCEECAGPLID